MKTRMRYLLFLALIYSFLGTLWASPWENGSANSPFEKQRIDQVMIDGQGVFLLIDGFWLGSQAMQATPEGILVLENGAWINLQEAIRCGDYYVWQCRKCESWNAEGSSTCYNCGAPR